MIAQHMGGIPELSMALGPILLIAVFVKIARRNESALADDDDDWNDLGDWPVDDRQPVDHDDLRNLKQRREIGRRGRMGS